MSYQFKITKQLSSYEITIDLLKQIEKYLLKNIPEIVKINPEETETSFVISIIDGSKEANFKSIEDYDSNLFSDSTKRVVIHSNWCDTKCNIKLLDIKISFDRNKPLKSYITIEYEGNNSEEIAVAIYHGIKKIMDFNKTPDYYFYNKLFDMLVIIGTLLGVIILKLILRWTLIYMSIFYLIIIIELIIFFSFYAFLKNKFLFYTTFDSNRNRTKKKFQWLIITGLTAYIISAVPIISIIAGKIHVLL